ncbi:MAG: sugar nucleotide-binding protein [Candidatus Nanoarchaeia archaeon]|nr:sugar nucleotide-binding protein [Candidatus Nanoarchaeia archaeon]MDD5588411.1 sugar nucleotide-binding protein [Candidatus Nanoarchaeia archaeon]
MKKGLIFGNGYLGNRISGELGIPIDTHRIIENMVVGTNQYLDEYLKGKSLDFVINAIGKTHGPNSIGIDYCKFHKQETLQSNVSVAEELASACARNHIYFVHLGSGCIYQGDKNGFGYSEKDKPNFTEQFYAFSKATAEERLLELERINPNFKWFDGRLRMPVDDRYNKRNLIDKLKEYAKVIDIQNSMITVPHMISGLRQIIKQKLTGIYNFTNPGTISAFEIMTLYKKIVDPNHRFELMSLGELNNTTKDIRSNCKLNTDKLESAGIKLPKIYEAVEECLIGYKKRLDKK